MQIETRKVYDVLVADLSGRLDSRTAGDAGDRLVAIAQGADRHVVLNLERLDYVSSAGLRIILRAAKLLQASAGRLTICGPGGNVRNVLENSRFRLPAQDLRHREGRSRRTLRVTRLVPRQPLNDELRVHHVAEDRIEGDQRRVVLLHRHRRVGVAHHDRS